MVWGIVLISKALEYNGEIQCNMKIRTQFYLLIAGIILIPIIMGGLFFLIQKRNAPVSLQPIPGYEDIVKIAGNAINREAWDQISDFLSRRPPWADFIITDINRTILFSTLSNFPGGTKLSDSELTQYIRDNTHHYIFQFDAPTRLSNNGLLVITQALREKKRPPNPVERFLQYGLIVLLTLLIFTVIMSIIIANAITKSVLILEQATRRIAAGELDLEVAARGSNEITSLTSSLNRMRLALKEDIIRRSRFIMGISHDLKTPLALIKGYTEAIRDGITDDLASRSRAIDIILSKVEQLEGMIDDLMDFVRMDTSEWQQHLVEQPFLPFLQAFCKRVSIDAQLLHREVSFDLNIPEHAKVKMNEALITRVFENLVSNALRYTMEGGKVHITAQLENDPMNKATIVVKITDNGIGIDQEDLDRIFELFYRGTNSRREAGMGIGLSVVKSIIDSHGWNITVFSNKQVGSTFSITIPIFS